MAEASAYSPLEQYSFPLSFRLPLPGFIWCYYNLMDQYHLSSPQRVEAIRLFHLIQEFSQNPHHVMNAESLLKFLQRMGLKNNEVIKFLHEIDKEGKEMNQEYWGLCISRHFDRVQLKSTSDLNEFHTNFKMGICQEVFKPLSRYEQWDDNRLKTPEAKDATYAEIIQNWETVKFFLNSMDTNLISNNIDKINRCFSMCTLFPENTEQIIRIFEEVLKGNFLSTLEYVLTMNLNDLILIEILKTLCYLYQASKFPSINRILTQSFLFNPHTMKGLMNNISDSRVAIRYYTCVISTLIVHRIPSFRQEIIMDKQFFELFCQKIGNMREQEGLYYGLKFLIVLINEFACLEQKFQDENSQIVLKIFEFAISCLPNCREIECQAASLHLLAQCLKTSTIPPEEIKSLKMVTNVFDFKQDQFSQPLIVGALQMIKVALCFERVEAQQVLMGDKNFEHYLKKVLEIEHTPWQPMLLLLQILQIIASTHHSKILFEKELIEMIFKMTIPQEGNTNNGCIVFYLSEIILRLVETSLDSEWKITYLHEKQLLRSIGNLLIASMTNDEVMLSSYWELFEGGKNEGNLSNIFCHKQVFNNCFKSLYLLTSETKGCEYQKKKQLYIKEFKKLGDDFVAQLWKAMRHYLVYSNNFRYTLINLKQEHKILEGGKHQVGQKMKMSKIICTVIEEMTYCLRKRNISLSVLKEVHQMRHYIYSLFYERFTYQQLESESIPIYFTLIITVDGRPKEIRSRYHRLSWSHFQACLTEAIRNQEHIEPANFNIKQKRLGWNINTELEYHKLMEEVFNNFKLYAFTVTINVFNIQKRIEPEIGPDRPMPVFGTRNDYTGSYRDSPNRRPEIYGGARFSSARLPEARGSSPFGSYRGSSDRNRNSPTFNAPCRYCSILTPNRSGICNHCANRY